MGGPCQWSSPAQPGHGLRRGLSWEDRLDQAGMCSSWLELTPPAGGRAIQSRSLARVVTQPPAAAQPPAGSCGSEFQFKAIWEHRLVTYY